MKKIILVFGLLAGAIVSTIMAISMSMCYRDPSALGDNSMLIGYLSMIIAFSLIYVAVKNYRDKYNDGTVSFGKAFKIGFFVTLIASTMYVLVWAIMYNFFMPDFMDVYTVSKVQQAGPGASGAEVKAITDEMGKYKEMYKNPLFFVLFTYFEILPVGVLVSLITALILKRRRQEPVMA
jgi:hypothetical protein